jgi:chromosome segregation ATPase
LEELGEQFQQRERVLDLRDRDLRAAQGQLQAESESVTHLRLRLEAERARADARDADRRAELDRRQSALDARERLVARLESNCVGWYRLWGRRRKQEVERLRTEQEVCRQERAEWAAAVAVWLRAGAKLREERRALAARALALEQWRAECLDKADRPDAAAKRLERIERQWSASCAGLARELERLRATVEAAAARLDDRSRRARQEVQQAAASRAALDDRAAEIEREELALEAERARAEGQLAQGRARWERAERRAEELRDEVERVARLLIDAPAAPVPASQAA